MKMAQEEGCGASSEHNPSIGGCLGSGIPFFIGQLDERALVLIMYLARLSIRD